MENDLYNNPSSRIDFESNRNGIPIMMKKWKKCSYINPIKNIAMLHYFFIMSILDTQTLASKRCQKLKNYSNRTSILVKL